MFLPCHWPASRPVQVVVYYGTTTYSVEEAALAHDSATCGVFWPKGWSDAPSTLLDVPGVVGSGHAPSMRFRAHAVTVRYNRCTLYAPIMALPATVTWRFIRWSARLRCPLTPAGREEHS